MFKELSAKSYVVGGAVRDELMGLVPKDIDYVVQATESEFRTVFPDSETVGGSFPVYLINGNEVALTRTEKSTGNGYGDFELTGIGVSIHDDLGRRDFTINSIARHIETGQLVDPYRGRVDIQNQVIRTINDKAFEEDPLRILRGIRFANRYGFVIDPLTRDLMYKNQHRIHHLPKERIVLELEKMWKGTKNPSHYFRLIQFFELGNIIFPAFQTVSKTKWNWILDKVDYLKIQNGSFGEMIALLYLAQDNSDDFLLENPIPGSIASFARNFKETTELINKGNYTQSEIIKLSNNTKRNHEKIINLLWKVEMIKEKFLQEYKFLCTYKFQGYDIDRIAVAPDKTATRIRIYEDALERLNLSFN